jgi:S-DNA-T family DNA segregation ATPase FtsK/SpoIIIE
MQRRGIRKYDGGDVYVIIDEFADLILADKAVKPIIQRLAQIGRAANVHIILATQTPISKVLPTEIKCNFDARFGLRTRSAQDSRNIIGRTGLELLPDHGQSVYMTPQGETLYKVPYIPDEELERITEHWNRQRHLFGRFQAARELKTQFTPGRG